MRHLCKLVCCCEYLIYSNVIGNEGNVIMATYRKIKVVVLDHLIKHWGFNPEIMSYVRTHRPSGIKTNTNLHPSYVL